MKEKITVKRRNTPIKKRGARCYERKVAKITKWHDRLTKIREKSPTENLNNKLISKRKELLPLQSYIDKITKPTK